MYEEGVEVTGSRPKLIEVEVATNNNITTGFVVRSNLWFGDEVRTKQGGGGSIGVNVEYHTIRRSEARLVGFGEQGRLEILG